MIHEILQRGQKFLVEVFYAGKLIDVQVEKVAEGVVIWLELVHLKALVQSLQHLLRSQTRWREWWADLEHFEHYFFRER